MAREREKQANQLVATKKTQNNTIQKNKRKESITVRGSKEEGNLSLTLLLLSLSERQQEQ
jgi:hypothetical protein